MYTVYKTPLLLEVRPVRSRLAMVYSLVEAFVAMGFFVCLERIEYADMVSNNLR
jgi:hypothetical protein